MGASCGVTQETPCAELAYRKSSELPVGELVRLCRGCGVGAYCGTKDLRACWAEGQTEEPWDQVLVPEIEGCAWVWLSLRGDLWDTGNWLAGARVGPVCPTRYIDGVCLVSSLLLWAECRIQREERGTSGTGDPCKSLR